MSKLLKVSRLRSLSSKNNDKSANQPRKDRKGASTLLIVDVSQILEHVGETQIIDVPYEINLSGDDYKVISPVQLNLILISTGKSILVQGNITGKLEAKCSRCLKSFTQDFNLPVEEDYKKPEEMVSVSLKDKELGEEDFIYCIDSEGTIDLSELVGQNILVNLPLQYICKSDCMGVERRKDNQRVEGDPRLAKLRDLKERKK
ncbi:MAG: DUF177 domain-containing protein [Candidatus Margulisbacteria bacterium]|nr:DUF177 domain-containing protein [Candidatus Margulisiibacteriota bacterium]